MRSKNYEFRKKNKRIYNLEQISISILAILLSHHNAVELVPSIGKKNACAVGGLFA